MIGYGLDRGGPKDSEIAPNSFLTIINGKGFWRFAPDICQLCHLDADFANLLTHQRVLSIYNHTAYIIVKISYIFVSCVINLDKLKGMELGI